jgi:AcrR family transcriptional regulator
MNEELTARVVAPIELPPAPDPDPDTDPISLAVVTEVVEQGYEEATVDGVIRRAGVSREDFNGRFASLDACALDTYERLIVDFKRRVGSAFNEQRQWPAALRAAAYASTDWMTERPQAAAFGSAEVLKMRSELARVRREEIIGFCAELVDRGREVAADPGAIPDTAPIVAIGAIAQLLTHRVQEGVEIHFPAVVPEMMHRIVSSYLGAEAAEAEWTAPRPSSQFLSPDGKRW